VVALASALFGSTGETSQGAGDTETTTGSTEPGVDNDTYSVTESCIATWNAQGADELPIDTVSGYVEAGKRVYVSVGPSADFPDQCLVTMAEGGFHAIQWQHDGREWRQVANGDVQSLDSTTKQ